MEAVLFGKVNGLSSLEVRLALVRIPEVLSRLKVAQKILDDMSLSGVDIIHSMTVQTELSRDMNNLLTTVTHVALFERYLKSNNVPEFIVCMNYFESPIPFCLGRCSFESLIIESKILKSQTLVEFPNRLTSKDLLELDSTIFNSYNFEKFSALHLKGMGNRKIVFESQSSDKTIEKLIHKFGVRRFINIGPFDILFDSKNSKFHKYDVEVRNSLELDPNLQWFYPSIEFLKAEITLVS